MIPLYKESSCWCDDNKKASKAIMRFDSKRNKLFRIRDKTMSTTAKTIMSTWSFLFSSLPNDIVLNILARVPRRYHPIISCVSKELRSLIGSSELHKTRSLLGKDCFYVCLIEFCAEFSSYQWFTLTEDRRLVSIPFPSPPEPSCFAAVTVGHDIYFVGRSRSMWILDSRSGTLRQGPSLLVACDIAAVGLVNDKIYIFGACCQNIYQDIQAQVFDLKTQTWQIAPNPSMGFCSIYPSVVTQSLGRKIYAWNAEESIIVYDTRDGKCDKIIPVEQFNTSKGFCVVDNVLYMYYDHVGLMWYDYKEKEWRVVHGLKLNCDLCNVAMAEYNGKLALLWQERNKMEVWCAMIDLYGSSKVAIRGRVEWSDCLLSDVPFNYIIYHFIVCTD